MTLEVKILGAGLSVICAGFCLLFLLAFYKKTFRKALLLKGVASLCFLAVGGIAYFTGEHSPAALLVFVGLCFGVIGDEVIALCQVVPAHDTSAFVGGGSFFAVGHILYVIALFLPGKISWPALVLSFAVLAALSLEYEKHRKHLSNDMKIPLALYLGIVIFMASSAIGAFWGQCTLGAGLFALGGILFVASDNLLFAYKLGKPSKFSQNIALHATYYLAQLSIAWWLTSL